MAGGWIFDATRGHAALLRMAALLAVAAAVMVATVKAPPAGQCRQGPKVGRTSREKNRHRFRCPGIQ